MQIKRQNGIWGRLGTLFCMVATAGVMASCEPFFEDLPPCPHGVSLRFEAGYEVPGGAGSQSVLGELVLVIYDRDSNWVDTRYLTQKELADRNFRLEMEMPEGRYHFIAYSGLIGTAPSFGFVHTPDTGSRMADLQTVLDGECLIDSLRRHLTDFYWGATTLTTADSYAVGTLRLMKNTNNIRIMLQMPDIIDSVAGRFAFEIIDDNRLFNYRNELLPYDTARYQPWISGALYFDPNAAGNETEQGASGGVSFSQDVEDYTIYYAELSTSRLMDGKGRLVVRDAAKGAAIIDIPLTKYLEQAISEHVGGATQDYLDRESQYTLHFFLSKEGWWTMTYIIVNGWIVRIDEMEL